MAKFIKLPSYSFSALMFIIAGMFFRLYNSQGYGFGYDQVQILENSQSIVSGNLTLIGPRTGPAAMFTGPLIYYLNAFSLVFLNNPYSLVLTNALMALTTGVSMYFLGKRYLTDLSRLAQYVPLGIWATSPFLIILDRTVWNPNLSLLSVCLVFFPLLKQSQLNKLDQAILAIGTALSFQAHFTLLLLPLITVPILMHRVTSRNGILKAISAGYFFTLLPVIIFDVRNHWLNLNGLKALIMSKSETSSTYSLIFIDTLRISLETIGKLISDYRGSISSIILSMVIFIIAIFLNRDKKTSYLNQSCLLWVLATVTSFSFYPGPKPEYYFFVLVPAGMVLFATVVSKIKLSLVTGVLFSVMAIFLLKTSWQKIQEYPALALGNVIRVVNYAYSQNQSISIDLKVPFGDHYGLEYLIKNRPVTSTNQKAFIYYPNPPAENFQEFNGLYLSFDEL